ncbi:hypothetical protein N9D38_00170 [Rubripirellula sp.]|nr:hypothetical protein [Rubripirellula sp.]
MSNSFITIAHMVTGKHLYHRYASIRPIALDKMLTGRLPRW